jgi:glycosyltransferase involved in cell wall biosynthesis
MAAGDQPTRRLIIIPAHNEERNIAPVLTELKPVAMGADILVIDDASRDRTAPLARRMGAKVITLPCNLGYGGAVQTGFKYAVENGYDVVVMMDADGQHDPAGIPTLLELVESGRADVALGSRFLGRLEYPISWTRRLGMSIFATIASWAAKQRISDPTTGFQALNASALRFLARDNYPTDFPDADLLMVLFFAGFRVIEAPVTMRERLSGVSMHSVNLLRPLYYIIKMTLSMFIVILRQRTRSGARRPDPVEG